MSEIIEILNLFEHGVKGYNRMNGSVISTDGVSQGIRANSGGHNEVKIMIWGGLQEHQTPRTDGICPTINAAAGMGGGQTPVIEEPTICAMRGRNPDNPTSRKSGIPTEQRIEIKDDGTSNTLTTVQKDNLVVEPSGMYTNVSLDFNHGGLDGLSGTLKSDDKNGCNIGNRIRKLTPRECWRLMDFDDEDFNKAKAAGVSDSQLYKQAGNSICVGVLEAIFRQMF